LPQYFGELATSINMRPLEIIQATFLQAITQVSKGIEIIGHTVTERFWVNLRPFFSSSDVISGASAQAFEKILVSGEK
jgi:hypothetical protein